MTDVFKATELQSSQFSEELLAPPTATPLAGDIVVRDCSYLADDARGIYSGSQPGGEQCTCRRTHRARRCPGTFGARAD